MGRFDRFLTIAFNQAWVWALMLPLWMVLLVPVGFVLASLCVLAIVGLRLWVDLATSTSGTVQWWAEETAPRTAGGAIVYYFAWGGSTFLPASEGLSDAAYMLAMAGGLLLVAGYVLLGSLFSGGSDPDRVLLSRWFAVFVVAVAVVFTSTTLAQFVQGRSEAIGLMVNLGLIWGTTGALWVMRRRFRLRSAP